MSKYVWAWVFSKKEKKKKKTQAGAQQYILTFYL